MKRVLILLGRFFPKASPNSICIKNIIDSLPKDKYEIEIICYDDGQITKTEYKVNKISRGLICSLIYSFEDKSGLTNKLVLKLLRMLFKIKLIPFCISWPWYDPVFTFKEWMLAKKIHKKSPVDIIISVHMPLSSIIVGHKMKRKYPSMKYIAYFLDSLSGGYVPHIMSKKRYNEKSIKWEKRLLSNADKIVFMDSSKKYHDSVYKSHPIHKKIQYLDLPMLRKQKNEREDSSEITIVYVGSLALGVRSPEYILKVFSLIPYENWKFIFVGESNCEVLNKYAAKDKRVQVVGRCSHEEALSYEKKATALLNLGNYNPNLTPSKVFEYMSFGKKIISTFRSKYDSSIKYLSKYPAVFFLNEKDQNIDGLVNKLIDFIENNKTTISFDSVESIFWKNTPKAFIELL